MPACLYSDGHTSALMPLAYLLLTCGEDIAVFIYIRSFIFIYVPVLSFIHVLRDESGQFLCRQFHKDVSGTSCAE